MAWPTDAEQLAAAQRRLAGARPAPVEVAPAPEALTIGGCAICFPRGVTGAGAADDPAWSAATVWQAGCHLAHAAVATAAGAPYRAGLLALREGPGLEAAVRQLPVRPDVLLVDATGRDHPRRAGLALHLGAVLDLPTVGVTHRPLRAQGDWPEDERGATAPLWLDGEAVAVSVRTRRAARPVAVHPAWRTDADTAVAVVMAACRRARTPEPLREARRLARVARAHAVRRD